LPASAGSPPRPKTGRALRGGTDKTPDHSNNFEIPVSEKHLKTNRQNIQILPKRSTTLLLRRQLENAPSPFLAFISCNSRYFLNEHNAIPSSIDPST